MELTKSAILAKFEELNSDFEALYSFCYEHQIPLSQVWKVTRLFPEYANQHTPDRDNKIKELKAELGL